MQQPTRIEGRPDFGQSKFGVTYATRHPKYVYSISGNSSLVHVIKHIEFHWWRGVYDHMEREDPPRIVAETVCGMSKFLSGSGYNRSNVCILPRLDSVLCNRCHGKPPNFPRNDPERWKKRKRAHIVLGCEWT